MILASASGAPINAPVAEIPNVEPQLIEEKKTKEEVAQSVNTEAYIRNYFSDIPLLAEVSRCESGFRQIDAKTGKTLRGIKNNKDVGAMQINEYYHGETAKKMGLDLHTLEDNLKFARYLYEKNGARDWLASSPCWSHSKALAQSLDSKAQFE